MKPSNHPDIGLGQEWFEELDEWIRAHGLKGWDPFDVKQHPWIQKAQPYYWPRKITTALCDLFPNLSRKLLQITPTENPKAHALVALGSLRVHALTQEAPYLETALTHLGWLHAQATPGYSGLCWGYPFHIHAKGLDTPPGTPVAVITSIAGQAFLRVYEATKNPRHLEAAVSIADFFVGDLPRLSSTDSPSPSHNEQAEPEDGGPPAEVYCFAYTPGDRRRVHNANLLVAEHLIVTAKYAGNASFESIAEPALQFTLRRQREDGAWTYGESAPGEPYDSSLLALIDHHHTGFVLRSLRSIYKTTKRADVLAALEKGFQYYRTLYTPLGMPINDYGKYPVDIHACAEGILCPAMLSDVIFAAKKYPVMTLRWAHWNLRNPHNGTPYYRKYPYFTSRLLCPRWGVAWMYWALAEYLWMSFGQRPISATARTTAEAPA